jgi:hypothetical protein
MSCLPQKRSFPLTTKMRPEGLREEFHIGWLKINYLAGIPEVRGGASFESTPNKVGNSPNYWDCHK